MQKNMRIEEAIENEIAIDNKIRLIAIKRNEIINLADTIKGEINRMCVTDDLTELDIMYQHAKKNLDNIAKMIYDLKFKSESEDMNE